MGIVFWLMLLSIVFLFFNLVLYIFKEKVDKLLKDKKPSKYIGIIKKVSESLYNYLSVHHIISMTSLTIYLWYEYVEKGCFELTCFVSDAEISATKLVKLEVVVAIILLIGQSVHFCRIFVFYYKYKWYGLQGELDLERSSYRQNHQHLRKSGFGSGYNFEMYRFELNKG
jgi:hypothetical protein